MIKFKNVKDFLSETKKMALSKLEIGKDFIVSITKKVFKFAKKNFTKVAKQVLKFKKKEIIKKANKDENGGIELVSIEAFEGPIPKIKIENLLNKEREL